MDRRTLLTGGQAALLSAVLPGSAAAAKQPRRDAFAVLRDRYFLGALQFNPVTATYLGGDGYSPRLADINSGLRDYRPEALADERAFYREVKTANDAIPPQTLSAEDRIDHEVLAAQLNFILHQLEDLKYHQRAVDTYVA
ncbi:MAG: hypothetical protein JWO33_948, partial [Caulobacteraceae bacterium]|nr:hypothetical protein [Caulobacteraceae bacterium]